MLCAVLGWQAGSMLCMQGMKQQLRHPQGHRHCGWRVLLLYCCCRFASTLPPADSAAALHLLKSVMVNPIPFSCLSGDVTVVFCKATAFRACLSALVDLGLLAKLSGADAFELLQYCVYK